MGLGASRAADFRLSAPPAGVTEKSPLVVSMRAWLCRDWYAWDAPALAGRSSPPGQASRNLLRCPLIHHVPTHPSVSQLTLGWYGAQDRHLAKYAALLNKEGYRVLRGTMPGSAVFSPWAWPRRRYAAALLDQVREMDPAGQRPLVLYAFSNGASVCAAGRAAAAAGRRSRAPRLLARWGCACSASRPGTPAPSRHRQAAPLWLSSWTACWPASRGTAR